LRVAVRRLRSTIAVFRPAIACPLVDSTNLGLEALGDRVAPARDWDVFVAETCAQVEQALPDDTGLRRLHAGAERRRREAYAALRSWLQGADFRQLGVALAGLAGGEAWLIPVDAPQQEARGLELETFGSQALRRRLRRLTEAGEAIEHLDAEALHAIRLRAKRMRYAAEVFAPVFPGRPARRFLRRLANLQDCLGVLNDGTVADALLGELGADRGARAHAAGLVRGFLAARAGQARGQIGRAWQRFRRLEPFWT
jgi:CHAD domain-containing protein